MAEAEDRVKRVLHMKIRALGDPRQVLALMKSATPFYRSFGGTQFRFLQNVDDPARFLIEIEYEAGRRARAQPPQGGERPDGARLSGGLAAAARGQRRDGCL